MSGKHLTKGEVRRKELFEHRDREFLRAAIRQFRDNGVGNLTLTNLANKSDYSKGTWYNHFSSNFSLIVSLAEVNARLQFQYFSAIVEDKALKASEKLTSIFFDYINHAVLNPEIWLCGIIARVWHSDSAELNDEKYHKLRSAEEMNRALVVELVSESNKDKTRTTAEILTSLDTIRAATAGLCILNIVDPNYAWSKRTFESQSIDLIVATINHCGLIAAKKESCEQLWGDSIRRTRKISSEWQI